MPLVAARRKIDAIGQDFSTDTLLFGRIPARQDVLAGSYSDNLLLQVDF